MKICVSEQVPGKTQNYAIYRGYVSVVRAYGVETCRFRFIYKLERGFQISNDQHFAIHFYIEKLNKIPDTFCLISSTINGAWLNIVCLAQKHDDRGFKFCLNERIFKICCLIFDKYYNCMVLILSYWWWCVTRNDRLYLIIYFFCLNKWCLLVWKSRSNIYCPLAMCLCWWTLGAREHLSPNSIAINFGYVILWFISVDSYCFNIIFKLTCIIYFIVIINCWLVSTTPLKFWYIEI